MKGARYFPVRGDVPEFVIAWKQANAAGDGKLCMEIGRAAERTLTREQLDEFHKQVSLDIEREQDSGGG